MNRRNRISLAAIVGACGAVLGLQGVADAQTRAQAPRRDPGPILREMLEQRPDNGGGVVRTPVRSPLRDAAGDRDGRARVIVDRDGRRRVVRRAEERERGVSISGSRVGEDGSIPFHIGTGRGIGHRRHVVFPSLAHAWYPYWGYSSYDTGRGYETPTVIIIENPPGAGVRTNELEGPGYAEPVAPPTVTDVALAAMARGDWDDAIARWRERLAEAPDDASAVRALGLSMALKGDMQTGTAMVAHAYQMSPQLVHERLDVWALGGESEMRRSLRRFVIYANSKRTESAWLTVAALMQAEGRDDHAARMVHKAREAGLDEELARSFAGALGAE